MSEHRYTILLERAEDVGFCGHQPRTPRSGDGR